MASWRPDDAQPAEQAAYAEDALVLFLDRPATMRRLVERVWEVMRACQFANGLDIWHEVSILFHLALHQTIPLRDSLARCKQAGLPVEREEACRNAVRELTDLRARFRKSFPAATEEEAEADRRAVAQGDYLDDNEAFADIAGVDLDTWRTRAAKSAGIPKC
jgi:hypothetical protein